MGLHQPSWRGLPSAIVVVVVGGGSTAAERNGKVGQCDVRPRAGLEAGHGVSTTRPWQWSVLPLPSLKNLGATGVDPEEAMRPSGLWLGC